MVVRVVLELVLFSPDLRVVLARLKHYIQGANTDESGREKEDLSLRFL
jgi:hypothetical protein